MTISRAMINNSHWHRIRPNSMLPPSILCFLLVLSSTIQTAAGAQPPALGSPHPSRSRGSACFITPPQLPPALRASSATSSSSPLFLVANSQKQQKQTQQKINKTTRSKRRVDIPRHHEAAGISSGIGLWTDIRRRIRRRRQRLLADKWNWKQIGRAGRMGGVHPNANEMNGIGENFIVQNGANNDNHQQITFLQTDSEEDEFANFSLDAMRAKSGVLRTGIRLKQDELRDLERLMDDLVVELRRSEIQRKRRLEQLSQNNEQSSQNGLDGNLETASTSNIGNTIDDDDESDQNLDSLMNEFQLDLMKKRSAELQSTILLDRIQLQRLERSILCCESTELGLFEKAVGNTLDSLNDLDFQANPFMLVERLQRPLFAMQRQARKFTNTFGESTSVLLRKIDRVSSQTGRNNRNYTSVTDYLAQETAAGVRIVTSLLTNPTQLSHLVDPDTPTLVPHVPAILARLDRLETHVEPILSRVLNNKQHLRTIEPYLPEILERFDDIEPHLPWILDHIDTLAPYTGLLLKHIDELLLYAEVDDYESDDGSKKDDYAFAEQLLPYLETYVSQLDLVGPHLPLLRPHLPLLLKHNRIKILSPHVGVLFSKGYKDLSASANMDILLFWFGWALRIPFVPRIFFSFPGSPGMVSFLANRLPKRLVRGRCSDVSCYIDGNYGGGWNSMSKEYEMEKEVEK